MSNKNNTSQLAGMRLSDGKFLINTFDMGRAYELGAKDVEQIEAYIQSQLQEQLKELLKQQELYHPVGGWQDRLIAAIPVKAVESLFDD